MTAASLLAATPAPAQDDITNRPSIVVVGQGEAEQTPDSFRVIAGIQGRGATQVEALRALAATQSSITEGLQRLDGLERADLTTSNPGVSPTFDPACGAARNDDRENCPVVGYVAEIGITLEGAPVDRAGDAVSLAAERGARDARLQAVFLASDRELASRAKQAAFVDARRQADALAQASGQRVVRILRIQEPGGMSGIPALSNSRVDEIVVTGSRIQPSVRLDVAPPPVRVESRLTVVFEIE